MTRPDPGEYGGPAGPLATAGEAAALAGDARLAKIREDFLIFYDREYHGVVRFVMRCGASLLAAEDAVQDAFVDAWELTARIDAWTAITEPRGWIRRVALRKYRRPPGKHRRPPTVSVGDLPEMPQPGHSQMDLTDGTLFVVAALRRLAPEMQAVMAFHLDGFTGPQIASQLGITAQKARDVLKAARKILARDLAGVKRHEEEAGR
jgi:DNA-directed RNA polymerase specialized sigma24 family protein